MYYPVCTIIGKPTLCKLRRAQLNQRSKSIIVLVFCMNERMKGRQEEHFTFKYKQFMC